ncbi:MAG: hypothetical protein AAGF56_12710 [Pseudomonadota bacterium]
MIEAGNVALPYNADWLEAFEQELNGFPNATHDDQVDAFTQYLCWFHDTQQRMQLTMRRI